jgi:hypothetical protein
MRDDVPCKFPAGYARLYGIDIAPRTAELSRDGLAAGR